MSSAKWTVVGGGKKLAKDPQTNSAKDVNSKRIGTPFHMFPHYTHCITNMLYSMVLTMFLYQSKEDFKSPQERSRYILV